MRPTFGIIIMRSVLTSAILTIAILTLTGCATPDSEYEKARSINSIDSYKGFLEKYPYSRYTDRTKTKIAKLKETQRRKSQIKNNWGKLSKGMSVDEVDSLVGPLNRGAVRGIKNMAENKNATSGRSNAQKSGGGFPYRGHYFTLQFDATGKLSEWSLK